MYINIQLEVSVPDADIRQVAIATVEQILRDSVRSGAIDDFTIPDDAVRS
jgi:hypothetical protein